MRCPHCNSNAILSALIGGACIGAIVHAFWGATVGALFGLGVGIKASKREEKKEYKGDCSACVWENGKEKTNLDHWPCDYCDPEKHDEFNQK